MANEHIAVRLSALERCLCRVSVGAWILSCLVLVLFSGGLLPLSCHDALLFGSLYQNQRAWSEDGDGASEVPRLRMDLFGDEPGTDGNRVFHGLLEPNHQITTIAMAAYTFTSFTMAIVGMVKYKKYSSPVFSASKAISFAAACVSMLTLESTMLTAFEDGSMDHDATRQLFLGSTGAVILAVVLAMAIYMIVQSSKKLKQLSENETA